LPKDPHVPWVARVWKGPAKWLGNLAILGGILGVTLHYLRFGPKQVEGYKEPESGQL
jgi:formate dehydrogenase iron-sulfur subunit